MLVPLILLVAFVLLPLLDKDDKPLTKQAAVVPEMFPSTGFIDYDLLPNNLKQRMEELIETDTTRHYSFYYFFETDDINRHFFLDDEPSNMILESQTVENQEALALVDQRLLESEGSGFNREEHPDFWQMMRDRETARGNSQRMMVTYIFPEYKADFRQLRVGIIEDTTNYFAVHRNEIAVDIKTYNLNEVDTPPRPVRGEGYLHDAIRKYLNDQLVYFQFYDMSGIVHAEFTVGGKASSPQIIEGFSTRETERDEAYKLDGLIVKALNTIK